MRGILLSVGLLASLLVLLSHSVLSRSEPKERPTPAASEEQQGAGTQAAPDQSSDEAAIRANIEALVRAYNAGDAKEIAALFIPDGQIVDKEGKTVKGRPEIEKTFAGLFADSPQTRMEVTIDSIRFVGPDLAVEEGSTKESVPGESPEYDRYTVLHVKRDGKWFMALARDTEGETPSNKEQLQQLAWLVGDWIDDGGSVVVFSTCR